MSRSCHSATFSTAAWALPRSTRARPQMRSLTIGLRLCGIALEPFCCPERNGSSASRTSVRCRWRISVASRSSPAPASAIACSSCGVTVARDDLGRDGSAASPSRASTRASKSGSVAEYVPTAPDSAPTDAWAKASCEPLGVALGLEREAGELDAERRRLGLHAVRAPDADGLDVLARALGERRDEPARAGDDDLARRADLQRERGVEHVGRGQAEVDPAPGRSRARAQHVHEGGDVVVGDRARAP